MHDRTVHSWWDCALASKLCSALGAHTSQPRDSCLACVLQGLPCQAGVQLHQVSHRHVHAAHQVCSSQGGRQQLLWGLWGRQGHRGLRPEAAGRRVVGDVAHACCLLCCEGWGAVACCGGAAAVAQLAACRAVVAAGGRLLLLLQGGTVVRV
jgi:hypothetical protein